MSLAEARSLVAAALGCPIEAVAADAAVGRQHGWDSLGHLSIVMSLEQRIGRQLRPDEIGKLKSVVEIAGVLHSGRD